MKKFGDRLRTVSQLKGILVQSYLIQKGLNQIHSLSHALAVFIFRVLHRVNHP
ncbi:RNAligase, partial [Perilla frutescens var. hirtella]